jgi:DNA-binding LacI/PurR family transcriptional regulator
MSPQNKTVTRSTPVSPAKPTVLDVAAAAAVSVGTVSRVLNTPDSVGQDIRKRVLEVVASLGYKPLRKRRKGGMVGDGQGGYRRRGNFGVLLMGMDESLAHLPVITEALHGVELAMAAEGMNLMIANVPSADRVPVFLAKNQVDGLIIKSPLFGDLRLCASAALVEAINRIPHVWLLGKPDSADGDMCGTDFDVGARIGVEYLYARGHRNFAYLHPRQGQTRSEGLKRALSAHAQRLNMKFQLFEKAQMIPVKWPLSAVTQPAEVLPPLERWLALPVAERPTAIIVGADSIAVQLYAAMRQLGVKVGVDVSVLSFNHEKPLVMGLSPTLTTIDIRAEAIGRRAVQQLFWRIRNKADTFPTKILVEPRLVDGESVAVVTPAD